MASNILKKQAAYVIGEMYGMFPKNKMRFEMEIDNEGDDWGFFANKSNRTVCHIKFEKNNFPNPE